jgi:hypothetical protein
MGATRPWIAGVQRYAMRCRRIATIPPFVGAGARRAFAVGRPLDRRLALPAGLGQRRNSCSRSMSDLQSTALASEERTFVQKTFYRPYPVLASLICKIAMRGSIDFYGFARASPAFSAACARRQSPCFIGHQRRHATSYANPSQHAAAHWSSSDLNRAARSSLLSLVHSYP